MWSFLLNSSTSSWRLCWGVWPSSRRYSNLGVNAEDDDDDDEEEEEDEDDLAAPLAEYLYWMKFSMMSNMEVHCENTNTFSFCHAMSCNRSQQRRS